MGLKAIDGFDHYNSSADLLARSNAMLQWSGINGGIGSPGRNGNGKCLALGGATPRQVTAVFAQRVAAAGVGHSTSVATGISQTMNFNDSVAGQNQVSITMNSANFSVEVSRGNTQLYYSANNVWGGQVWHYLEAWVVIDPTAGSILFKIDGETIVNLTGVNTQNTANAWWDSYNFQGTSNLDDFYYADSTTDSGTYPNNAPLGDMRVFTEFAVSNASVTWTPLTGTNWGEVSEPAMDSDTSYNYTTTAGAEDLLNFSSLPATANKILGVAVTGAYRKDDATSRTLKQALKSGSTEVYGTTYSLPDTNYSYFSDMHVLDPNTSANWTLAAVNGLEVGYNLVS